MKKEAKSDRQMADRVYTEPSRNAGQRVAECGIFVALAMIFSYVEAMIPINFGVPGMKLGIANLVVVVGLYFMKPGDVFLISMVRILLMGWMFGNGMSLIYSVAGGVLSFAVMLLLKKHSGLSMTGVSIAGGVSHNLGQILVAVWVVNNAKVMYYFPALLVAGVITGTLIGILSGRLLKAVRSIPGTGEKKSI